MPARDAITSRSVQTSRLTMHVLQGPGQAGDRPVLFVHGNVSSGVFFRRELERLPPGFVGYAPDLRSYGRTESLPVDATRGLRDWSDDLHSLVVALGLHQGPPIVLLGWSVGGAVVLQYALDHAQHVAGLVLEAPMSPYGFGGTHGLSGTPCFPDFAGSGGAGANPDFVARLGRKDRSDEAPTSPRNIMRAFYFKPPFRMSPEDEEWALDSTFEMTLGDAHYPGSAATSPNWPGFAPGSQGTNNAISPKYCNVSGFAQVKPQPKVLWVRGTDDQIVSDTSLFDMSFLGQIGAVPGWPGPEVCPPQPMVGQTRAVLDAYRQNGGTYEELVFSDCGHSPHLEKPDAFQAALTRFLQSL